MRQALLAFIISITSLSAAAYDFSAQNADGATIYYNINGAEAQVTFDRQFVPTESYAARLTIPSSVTSGGVTYPVTSVGKHAFFASRIEGIRLPESVVTIDDFAFAGCGLLTSVDLPASVSHIGRNVFDGCFALSDINVAGANPSFRSVSGVVYDKDAATLLIYPQGRDGEATVSGAASAIGQNAFYGCSFLPRVTIAENITSVGDNAFYFCNSLSSVSLPASVTSIGQTAFADCLNLSSIVVDSDNPAYTSVDGSLFDKEVSILLQSPGGRVGSSAIPESVRRISSLSFFRNIGLTTAIVPEGVTEIGEGAFAGCLSLSAVSIPASVRRVAPLAFSMCDSLRAVYVRNPLPETIDISADAFTGIDPAECTLYVPSGSLEAYSSSKAWAAFEIITEYESQMPQQIVWDTEYEYDGSEKVTLSLDAEASSGLPVSYTLAPECVGFAALSGNRLTMTADSEVRVTATQNGDTAYAPAEPVTRLIKPVNSITDPAGDPGIRVLGMPGKIIVLHAAEDARVSVYDIAGHMIYTGTGHVISVPSGNIYVVTVGKHAFKVSVR